MIRHAFPAAIAFWITTHACQAEIWSAKIKAGRIEASYNNTQQATWQHTLVQAPRRGKIFRNSAFLHPLNTPSGFTWTDAHPADHVHHSGLWWPWKFVEVGGTRYVTWEFQKGEGAHIARGIRFIHTGPDFLEWELTNETVIRKPGADSPLPVDDGIPVIRETVRIRLARLAPDANVLDLRIDQVPLGDEPVHISPHRYSGFTWRGPKAWNAGASRLISSEGHTRRNANGKPARWLLATGPGHNGARASVLIMSAATEIAGKPERLRVWNVFMHGGVPFINFNPVAEEKLTLNAATPAVATRQYRVIAADRQLTAKEAEAMWKSWRNPK